MKNMRAIKARIKSVESTRQITKSMKTVASSKLKKTQLAMAPMREYAAKCALVMNGLSASAAEGNPLLEKRETEKVCFVLCVGNRGLCGGYNSALLKYASALADEEKCEHFFVVCGNWGKDAIRAARLDVRKTFEVSDVPEYSQADAVAEYLRELFVSREADRIVFVYERFASVLSQVPSTKILLPLSVESAGSEAKDVIFEPNQNGIMEQLSDMYLKNSVYSLFLEARTGEHAARMTAMTSASDNTEELIAELQLELNHARQAAITTEVSEITGGAEALRLVGS